MGAQLVVQKPASCVVDSIPLSTLSNGVSALVLPPERAADWLARQNWSGAPTSRGRRTVTER
ncbi:MAG: hypothetical protein JW751_20810 [Polyangiaceae bacterium]|nr:hypothetical protein [Polyangiaceae bacterium]